MAAVTDIRVPTSLLGGVGWKKLGRGPLGRSGQLAVIELWIGRPHGQSRTDHCQTKKKISSSR